MKFRHLYIFIALTAFPSFRMAAQTPATLPLPYSPNTKVNFVRTWEATAPEQNPATLVARPLKDVKLSTAFFDGLGRPLQTVVRQGSQATGNSAVDLVIATVYDELGRERYKYLPFAANNNGGNTSINDGLFKMNPFQEQVQFYNTQLAGQPEINIGPDNLNWAYSKTTFEPSPLNRLQENFAPGSSWVGTSGESVEDNRRSVKTQYYFNTTADSIKKWTVTNVSNNWGSYAVAGMYAAGELYKHITIDEAGKQVIEFKDKEDKIILKKVQLTASGDNGSGSSYSGWLCTYYVFDNLNNLRLVIQPNGVDLLVANNWNIGWNNNIIINEQCFRYEYDGRNRPIRKRIPGTGEVWMIYDKWDRLVLTQDSVLRTQNQWLFHKYDALNRPVYQGKYYDATRTSQSTMQAYLDAQNMGRSETYTPAGGLPMYSLNQSFPVVTYSNILSITYYDDYVWANNVPALFRTFDANMNNLFNTASNTIFPYPQALQATSNTKGLITGTIVKALDSTTAFATSLFYDAKGRVIQTKAENYSWGCDITTTQYSFSGQVIKTVLKHEKLNANAGITYVHTDLTYDDLGRLKDVKKKVTTTINGLNTATGDVVVSSHEYDALGQLKKKTLGPVSGPGGGPMETLDQEYNIRGWSLGANRKYLLNQGTGGYTDRYFGYELGYDKTTTIPGSTSFSKGQYTGNISGTIWKSKGDGINRKFDFDYDAANRFIQADFNQQSSGSWDKSAGVDFSVTNLSYDPNGNILRMDQKGWKPGGSTLIDNLFYTYYPNSNRLQNVWDKTNDPQTTLGDFRSPQHYMTALGNVKSTGTVDYTYDGNGNLKKDRNKDIGTATQEDIIYNHLNLPQIITVRKADGTIKGTIRYTYDANGIKHRKFVQETGKPSKTTLYMVGFVYENDTLQFLGQEEGRIRYAKRRFTNGDSAYRFQFDYFLKDQLGNVRMVLTEQTDTTKYLASMEAVYRATENALFYNIPQTATGKSTVPGGYPTYSSGINPDTLVSKVNGSSNKIGPAIVLKVMSGDKVDIGVLSFYRGSGAGSGTNNPVADILGSLAGGIVGAAGESKGAFSALSNSISSPLLGPLNSFRNGNNSTPADKPKAYLNWILLDEQLQYVPASSGADPITDTGIIRPLTSGGPVTMTKNGFLYIYVSNETQNRDVFFDNLSIQHTTGPITEETHYYPFGLTMAGISSKALGKLANKKEKFQGQEFDDELEVNFYQFKWRSHDPQIGRFIQVDPLSEKYVHNSTYAFSENSVISHVELEGLEKIYINPKQAIYDYGKEISYAIAKAGDKIGGAFEAGITWFKTVAERGISVFRNESTFKISGSARLHTSDYLQSVEGQNSGKGVFLNTDFKLDFGFSTGIVQETKVGNFTNESSVIVDQDGNTKTEFKNSLDIRVWGGMPAEISNTLSSSTGELSNNYNFSLKFGENHKAGISLSTVSGNNARTELSVSGESKIGDKNGIKFFGGASLSVFR